MEGFHEKLKKIINEYVLLVYKITKQFPKDEIYGMTSQARRAALSVMLNYLEGYGRTKKGSILNFYEISFASLKESIYVIYLSHKLQYISTLQYQSAFNYKEEIARMLWKTMQGIKDDIKIT